LFNIATPEFHCGTSMYICNIDEMVHLLCFSSFYLSPFVHTFFGSFLPHPFLMVIWNSLKILYTFLYREYINHIHLLNFFLLSCPSQMWPPFSVTCFPQYCCICVRYIFQIWQKICSFGLLSLANFIKDDVLQLHPFTYKPTKFHSSLWLNKMPL
jgi:hypothetical protein